MAVTMESLKVHQIPSELLVEANERLSSGFWKPLNPASRAAVELLGQLIASEHPEIDALACAIAQEIMNDLGASAGIASAWIFLETPPLEDIVSRIHDRDGRS